MDPNQAKLVEKAVLTALARHEHAASMRQLVDELTAQDRTVQGVDVKIAAMNLVARGQASMNERWQLATVAGR